MANTQLACPHCGSALTFGMEIVAGTPIECLICMRSFPAQPASPPVAKVAPPPTGIAVPTKSKAAPPPIPVAAKVKAPPVPRRQPSQQSGSPTTIAMIVVGIGVLTLLLIVGIGYGMWSALKTTPAANTAETNLLASNENTVAATQGGGAFPGAKGANPPLTGVEYEDDLRRKREEEKIQLARKDPIKAIGSEFEFDPISSFNVPAESIAGLDQRKINAAIAKGVGYLKRTQNASGTWASGHDVGYAAIGGLTLLESGVPANDRTVLYAAAHVRSKAAENPNTYELSLAVLFLDRLGSPLDRGLIQWLSLRILAGQNESGGWSYKCPQPPPQELYKLYAFLQSHRPALHTPIAVNNNHTMQDPLVADPKTTSEAFQQFNQMVRGNGNDVAPLPAKKGVAVPPKAKGKGKTPPPINPMVLMPDLRSIPVVQNLGKKKGQAAIRQGLGDNSNTQFALLALWAARRHGIPSDAALVFGYQRFQVSQSPDGGWGYTHMVGHSTQTMTCVGLLGAAMGHGAAPDILGFNPKNPKEPILRPIMEDPMIQKGLARLSQNIGEPSKDPKNKNFPMQNLYYLWSVERVAMLYDLKTINGKDWYGWGAQVLVHNQQPGGEWINGQFHGQTGPINTCFALLFLRRSNLVQDLTNHLRLHNAIRDPG